VSKCFQELKEGLNNVIQTINRQNQQGGAPDQERLQRAMADPEIQGILRDPVMSNILNDMQTNPTAAQQYMRDPGVSAKIQKLIAAGVLQMK